MIIIAVLANDEGGYASMVQACRETCYSKKNTPEAAKVYYMYGNRKGVNVSHQESLLKEDCFYYGYPEGRNNLLHKTIAFYEYCYNNFNFEYIFRTNCGSYVNLHSLVKFVNNLPKQDVYLGMKGSSAQGYDHDYASGSGYLLSRNLIQLIVENKHKLEYNGIRCMDDNSIGKFLTKDNKYQVMDGALRRNLFLHEISNQTIDEQCYHYYFRHSIEPKCLYQTEKILGKKRETS